MAHALLSPSSAARWLRCPGSVVLTKDMQDDAGEYADEGSAAHWVAEQCLKSGDHPIKHLGAVYVAESGREIRVAHDMAEHVDSYVINVRQYAEGNDLFVEQRLPIGHITREADAHGTSDAVIITSDGKELQTHDLKYGRGYEVEADENEQLMLYALGALQEFEMILDMDTLETIRLVIHQPRITRRPKEWTCTVAELKAFADRVELASIAVDNAQYEAEKALPEWREKYLKPGPKQCQWCKAKSTCAKLEAFVMETVTAEFDDLTAAVEAEIVESKAVALEPAAANGERYARLLPMLDLIESWVDAVSKGAYAAANAGTEIPGYKLVEGKRGARAWVDKDQAEEALKAMRLKHDEMYTYSVISPTQAEKVLKDSPRRWNKLIPMIEQRDGKPTLVPASDKRPAITITPIAEQFDDLSGADLV